MSQPFVQFVQLYYHKKVPVAIRVGERKEEKGEVDNMERGRGEEGRGGGEMQEVHGERGKWMVSGTVEEERRRGRG